MPTASACLKVYFHCHHSISCCARDTNRKMYCWQHQKMVAAKIACCHAVSAASSSSILLLLLCSHTHHPLFALIITSQCIPIAQRSACLQLNNMQWHTHTSEKNNITSMQTWSKFHVIICLMIAYTACRAHEHYYFADAHIVSRSELHTAMHSA